jgi:hypothetical protein
MNIKATINVERWPEALFAMRRALANLIREIAHDESSQVAKRLNEIADVFEVGQHENL